MQTKRRLINFVIEPKTQLKILSQVILLLAGFFCIAVYVGYSHWKDTLSLLVEMSEVPDAARDFVLAQMTGFATNVLMLLLILFLFLAVLLIIHTHRFLGARYAICKHINENLKKGNFAKPLILRKNDYLVPIADSVNELSDILNKTQQKG